MIGGIFEDIKELLWVFLAVIIVLCLHFLKMPTEIFTD